MKSKIKLYVHQLPGKAPTVEITDMTKYGWYGVCLGVVVEGEPFDVDPVAAMVSALEDRIEQERNESRQRVNLLLDQISKLQCLEYQPEQRP